MAHFGSLLDTDTDVGENSRRLRWTDPYVVMAEYGHITVFDCTDPSALVVKQRYSVLANQTPDGLIVEHPLIYVSQGDDRSFYILDMTDPTSLVERDQVNFTGAQTGSFACDIAKQGNYVYVAGNKVGGAWNTIQIMNVSNPDNISQESDFTDATNLPTTPTGVAIDITGKYLFVAGSEYFTVLDISNPAAPVFSNRISTSPASGSDYQHIEVTEDGHYAFVTKFSNDSISIIDVSNPASISQVGTLTDATYLNGVRDTQIIDDMYLYSWNFSGATVYMSVWDIFTDPTSPTRLESLNVTTEDPWGDSIGQFGGFVIDPYQNLYVGRYSGAAAKGVASFGIEQYEDGLYVEIADTEIQAKVLGVRTERGRDDELGDVATGIALITCDNVDGDFSPENTGGAYYGTLDLGVKVEVYEVYLGTRYDHFTGKIDKIVPHDDLDNPIADITALDGLDDMTGRAIMTGKLTNTTVDQIIDDALDAIGWPAGDRSLDSGVDTMAQLWFHNVEAKASILQAAKQDGGFFYIDADGTAVFENRHHRLVDPHLTPQADFEDTMVAIDYEWSKRQLYNYCSLRGKRYTADSSNSRLWAAKTGDANDAPFIGAGDTVTMWAEFSLALDSYVAFVKGTHWNANTAADKSGTDVSDNITVTETQYGQAIKLVFENTGTIGAYLVVPDAPPGGETDLTALVYGKLLQEETLTYIEEDATSQAAYGQRSYNVDAPFNSRPNQLRAYAEFLIQRYKDPIPTPIAVILKAGTSINIRTQMLTRRISDRITLKSTRLSFDQDFFINGVIQDYKLREGIFDHETVWTVERAIGVYEELFWLLGETGFSELGETTKLGW